MPDDSQDREPSAEAEAAPPPEQETPLLVLVGVGASAGGLEAFRDLLAALPSDTNLAFAFIQHLSPGHESRLPEVLQPATDMPVEGLEIELRRGEVTRSERSLVIELKP